MTWNDLVRKYFPDMDDQSCDYLLWEFTSFPLENVEVIEKQIQHVKEIGWEAAQKESDDILASA